MTKLDTVQEGVNRDDISILYFHYLYMKCERKLHDLSYLYDLIIFIIDQYIDLF